MLKFLLKRSLFLYYVFLAIINLMFVIIPLKNHSFAGFLNFIVFIIMCYFLIYEVKRAKRLYLIDKYKECYIKIKISDITVFLKLFKYKSKNNITLVGSIDGYTYVTLGEYLPFFSIKPFINNNYKIINFEQILRQNKIKKLC